MKTLNEMGEDFVQISGVNCTAFQHIRRATEEMLEATDEAIYQDADLPNNLAEEMADVILTLAAAAAHIGFDLDTAIARKHATNMKRTWRPHPTIPGGVKHVK